MMNFLVGLRPRIAAKAVVLIAGLGLMSAVADWFSMRSVETLDRLSADVSQHLSPARLALAEAKTRLSELGLATYKMAATSDSDTSKLAAQDIADQYAAANLSLSNSIDYFPERTEDFNRIRAKLALVLAVALEAGNALAAGEGDSARTILDLKMEAALDDAMGQLNRLINILGGEVQAALSEAEAERTRTINRMLLTLIGGTLLTVLAAMALAHRLVSLPLQRLTEQVTGVRQSGTLDLQPDDRLLRRGDEIGVLGRSFNLLIEELSNARKQLVTQFERLDSAINNMPQGLCMFDGDQNLILCNRQYARIYRLTADQTAAGTPLRTLLDHRAANGSTPKDDVDFIESRLVATADLKPGYRVNELKDGRVVAISHQPMANGGSIAIHEDITERRKAEAQIAYMAHHDMLTHLPNRVRLREEMENALKRVDRGERIAILYIDLDHFKTINDTLGHPIGDVLLQTVADRIRNCIRPTDAVARLGGDEFAIVQGSADQPAGANALAANLIAAIGEPFDVHGHQVVIGASVGIAVAPNDGNDPDQLMKNADIALYHAKEDGRGTCRFFEPEMDERFRARRALEIDLRHAVAHDEFEVFYQPIVNLGSDDISGFEALLRWRSPTRGLVPPGDFIPLAEEIGIIAPIGAWVLNQACKEAAGWPAPIKVAVNLSPVQFKNGTLVLDVISALARSGLAARRLELEITETTLLQNTEATLTMLNQLRELGVRISMDDFGTGYSSLSYLRKFPFDKIKIDQSFIRDLSDKPDSIAIVRAVVGLGSTLGIATTAEGVEAPQQLLQLRNEGCTEVQGYLYSRPLPATELGALLKSFNSRRGRAVNS
jgi:diguanylate cyclase (GGDEF)-like protein